MSEIFCILIAAILTFFFFEFFVGKIWKFCFCVKFISLKLSSSSNSTVVIVFSFPFFHLRSLLSKQGKIKFLPLPSLHLPFLPLFFPPFLSNLCIQTHCKRIWPYHFYLNKARTNCILSHFSQ